MFWKWFFNYGLVILFYLAIILIIYFNRKKFHFEGKIIAMYRTKIGLKLMDKIGAKHPKTIRFFGILGIWAGFIGMLGMVVLIIFGIYLLIFRPEAPALFSPVIPGVKIPGSPVSLPLIEGILALFFVVVIHEFSHGVMARAYGLKIKSSGFAMMGPIPGAFVEPDEKKLQKSSKKAQLSIFSAGPFSNVLFFGIILALNIGVLAAASNIYEPSGVEIVGFVNASDGQEGGRLSSFMAGEVISELNGKTVSSVSDIRLLLGELKPGDTVSISSDKGVKSVVLTSDPINSGVPFLGLMLDTVIEPVEGTGAVVAFLEAPIFWIIGLLYWIWVLSFGIGIVNLLPIGPTDGGRMFLLSLQNFFEDQKAKLIWSKISVVLLVCLGLLIFVPILRAIF